MIPHIESQSFYFLIYLCLIENRSPFCEIAGNTTRSNSILRRTTIHSATLLKGHRFVRSSFSNWTLWTQGPPRICSEAVSNGRGHKLVCSVHEGPQHLLWKRRNCASISSQWNLCYHKSWFTGLGYRSATSPSSLAHTCHWIHHHHRHRLPPNVLSRLRISMENYVTFLAFPFSWPSSL